jgi:hypothetical protein
MLLGDPSYQWRFNLNAFERADISTRYRSYATARQWGWMSPNDVRHLEDMNEIDGGDEYLTPLNMVPLGTDQGDGAGAPADPNAPPLIGQTQEI